MYFTDSEAGILCGNIKKLLDQHGGCWITADTETAVQYVLTAQAFFGDRFMEYMMKGKERSEDKSDIKMGQMSMIVSPSGDTAENMRRAMMFLAYHGLKAERLIVADYAPELKSLEKATPEQAEKIREAMTKFAYWKITSVKTETLDTTDTQADNFKAEASLNGDMLSIALHGRLDTLSAPKLLTFFENTAEEHRIGEVSIDCKELDYISSAGLRVLMIMQKNSENGVYLRAINGSVREILEQTGFDSILNIVR